MDIQMETGETPYPLLLVIGSSSFWQQADEIIEKTPACISLLCINKNLVLLNRDRLN